MDPTANLSEQREIVARVELCEDAEALHEDLSRLAELVIALDEWISLGNFLPAQWQKK